MTETWHCALLRGVGPGNPNMRNERLRGVFERLGFAGVASVISSGNVLFATTETSPASVLEDRIQQALRDDLAAPGRPEPRLPRYDAASRAVLGIHDNRGPEATKFMGGLERRVGKEITTRTWLTVTRILDRFPD